MEGGLSAPTPQKMQKKNTSLDRVNEFLILLSSQGDRGPVGLKGERGARGADVSTI